jgi:hypothetical protein
MARRRPTADQPPLPERADMAGATGAATRTRRGEPKTFSSLQNNRDYRFLWTGNLFAHAAQWLQMFTIGWLVYSISGGSALHSVAVAAIRSLPILVIGPWAGVLADRLSGASRNPKIVSWIPAFAEMTGRVSSHIRDTRLMRFAPASSCQWVWTRRKGSQGAGLQKREGGRTMIASFGARLPCTVAAPGI